MSKRAMGEPRSKARPLMSKWARQEVEELVEEVFDGWMFDGPWTTEEYYRFRAALENAVLEAAPRIAFASERTQDRGRHTGAEPLLCPFCGGDGWVSGLRVSATKQKRRATYWQATTAMADCRPPSPNPEEE